MSESWTFVCTTAELLPGEMKTVFDETTEAPIAVFKLDGTLYALEFALDFHLVQGGGLALRVLVRRWADRLCVQWQAGAQGEAGEQGGGQRSARVGAGRTQAGKGVLAALDGGHVWAVFLFVRARASARMRSAFRHK